MDRRGRRGRPFEREKARIKATATNCERCGKPISAVFPWPDPRCVTIGHIVPLDYGGDPLAPENLAAQCIACNMSEGAHMTNAKRRGTGTSYLNGDW